MLTSPPPLYRRQRLSMEAAYRHSLAQAQFETAEEQAALLWETSDEWQRHIIAGIMQQASMHAKREAAEAYAAIAIGLQRPRWWERWYDRAIDWVEAKLRHVLEDAERTKFRQ